MLDRITKAGESLLKELQEELVKAEDSKKMLEGALQGIRMYHQRIADELQKAESSEDSVVTGEAAAE